MDAQPGEIGQNAVNSDRTRTLAPRDGGFELLLGLRRESVLHRFQRSFPADFFQGAPEEFFLPLHRGRFQQREQFRFFARARANFGQSRHGVTAYFFRWIAQ